MARPDGGQFANVLAPTLYDLSISSAERSPQVPRTDAVLVPGLGFREWIWGEQCAQRLVHFRAGEGAPFLEPGPHLHQSAVRKRSTIETWHNVSRPRLAHGITADRVPHAVDNLRAAHSPVGRRSAEQAFRRGVTWTI